MTEVKSATLRPRTHPRFHMADSQEEHKILASEIEARKWGFRVQPKLEQPKISMGDLQAVLKEASDLRGRLPLSPRQQKTWSLPQETEAKRLLDIGNGWLAKYRKNLQASGQGFKKNVGVGVLLELMEEAKALPVDVSEFTNSLSDALAGAERWYEEAKPLLKACGVKFMRKKVVPLKPKKAKAVKHVGTADSRAGTPVEAGEGEGDRGEEERKASTEKEDEDAMEVDMEDEEQEAEMEAVVVNDDAIFLDDLDFENQPDKGQSVAAGGEGWGSHSRLGLGLEAGRQGLGGVCLGADGRDFRAERQKTLQDVFQARVLPLT